MIWIVGATALFAGLLVGLTGIGGVLLVPVLTGAAGLPLERGASGSVWFMDVTERFTAWTRARVLKLPSVGAWNHSGGAV